MNSRLLRDIEFIVIAYGYKHRKVNNGKIYFFKVIGDVIISDNYIFIDEEQTYLSIVKNNKVISALDEEHLQPNALCSIIINA